jgi:tryptophanyl-tRNA synthetase
MTLNYCFMRVLSGIQPSGHLHLGNYFGAIDQFLRRQASGDELFIFIADWHALTTTRDPAVLQQNVLEVAAAYLALGLDPTKVVLYRQSDVPEIPELSWILSCLAPMGLLERAHSYKDKTARGLAASVGLFTYPILMAADILAVQSEVVPVGKDQKQHVEITRDLAGKFNDAYGETLTLPEPEIPEAVAVVPGTDGQKMSKSYGNTVDLFGSDAELQKQVMGIQTDSKNLGEPLDPDSCNVFKLFELVANENEIVELAEKYKAGAIGYGDAKKTLLAAIHAKFDPARAQFAKLIANPTEIEKILKTGAEKTRAEAQKTLSAVREKVGLTD